MNISHERDRLDRLTQKPVPPLWELTACGVGFALLWLACWMIWG